VDLNIINYWKKEQKDNGTIHQLAIDSKKDHDLVRREVFYTIINEFGIPMKLARPIKMCLIETYSKVCIVKNLSDAFPIQHHCFSTLLYNTLPGR